MEDVPLIDSTGVLILKKFLKAAASGHTKVILCGVRPEPQNVLTAMRVVVPQAGNFEAALELLARAAAAEKEESATVASRALPRKKP